MDSRVQPPLGSFAWYQCSCDMKSPTFGTPGRVLRRVFKVCFDMGDDLLERLRLSTGIEHRCEVRD
jgi:hypothetical protein